MTPGQPACNRTVWPAGTVAGAGGAGCAAFFFSSVTATEIARRRSSRLCATATRPNATAACKATETTTVVSRNGYSPLCWTLIANVVMPAILARSLE